MLDDFPFKLSHIIVCQRAMCHRQADRYSLWSNVGDFTDGKVRLLDKNAITIEGRHFTNV